MASLYGAFKIKKDANKGSILSLGGHYIDFNCGGVKFQGFERESGTNNLYYINDGGDSLLVYENGSWKKDYYRTLLFYDKSGSKIYGQEIPSGEEMLVDLFLEVFDRDLFSYDYSVDEWNGVDWYRGGWVFSDTIEYGILNSHPTIYVSAPFNAAGDHTNIEISHHTGYGWRIKYDGTTVYSNLNGWSNEEARRIIFATVEQSSDVESRLQLTAFLLSFASENVVVSYGTSIVRNATTGSKVSLLCKGEYAKHDIYCDVAPCVKTVVIGYGSKSTTYNIGGYVSGASKAQRITLPTHGTVPNENITISIK